MGGSANSTERPAAAELPEAKSDVAWKDVDTLWVGTKREGVVDSLTDSGGVGLFTAFC